MKQRELSFAQERRIYSVAEMVGEIRGELEPAFRDISVQGEISNLSRPRSGHLYFTLKDQEAQIAAVCFRLKQRYLRFTPEDGMDVVARGSVTVYPPRGQLQFMVEAMEPLGTGALQLAFEQLKARLRKEGLFEREHKQELPLLPSRIGIVTSPSGAAFQDILRVLRRRDDRSSILLYPSRVQGEGAAAEIAEGVRNLNERAGIDVIVVARGGGSLEDLWAFNEEVVARAIFSSKIPVISAVGHEIDFTIADFVADQRAATPTAAAELITERRQELSNQVEELMRRNHQAMLLQIVGKRQKLSVLASSRAFINAESRVKFLLQRLDELQARLLGTAPRLFDPLLTTLFQLRQNLQSQIQYYIKDRRLRQQLITGQLKAYSPLQVLDRGYAIVTKEEGQIVRSPDQVAASEKLEIQVALGSFRARKEPDNGV